MSISIFTLLLIASSLPRFESVCDRVCDLAIGSYYFSPNVNLAYFFALFGISSFDEILPYNPNIINKDRISSGSRINVPFPCNCINDDFLGHTFTYVAAGNEIFDRIVTDYADLTTFGILSKVNGYPDTRNPDGGRINVTVTCSCGNSSVSMDHGLFVTYPLRAGDSLKSLADGYGFSGKEDLLQRYNPGTNFSAGRELCLSPLKQHIWFAYNLQPLINIDGQINEKVIFFLTSSLSRIIM